MKSPVGSEAIKARTVFGGIHEANTMACIGEKRQLDREKAAQD